MPDTPVTIPSLPAAGSLTGAEQVPVEQSSTTVRTTTAAIAALASGGVSSFGESGTPRTGAIVIAPGSGVAITESPNGTFTFAASGGASAYDAAVLATSGLIHYWKMNDVAGSTSAADSVSSGGVALPIVGSGPTFGSMPITKDGETSALFAASDSNCLQLPSGTFPAITAGLTVEVVLMLVLSNNPAFWLSPDANRNGDFAIGQSGQNGVYQQVMYWNNGSHNPNLSPYIPNLVKIHLVWTVNSGVTAELCYVNGYLATGGGGGFGYPLQSGAGYVGRWAYTTGQAFGGFISKLAFYNTVLTPAQIAAHAALA